MVESFPWEASLPRRLLASGSMETTRDDGCFPRTTQPTVHPPRQRLSRLILEATSISRRTSWRACTVIPHGVAELACQPPWRAYEPPLSVSHCLPAGARGRTLPRSRRLKLLILNFRPRESIEARTLRLSACQPPLSQSACAAAIVRACPPLRRACRPPRPACQPPLSVPTQRPAWHACAAASERACRLRRRA